MQSIDDDTEEGEKIKEIFFINLILINHFQGQMRVYSKKFQSVEQDLLVILPKIILM